MNNNETIFSKHIFLFPFKWDFLENKKSLKKCYKDRLSLKDFDRCLNENLWRRSQFECNNINTYNETSYFYDNINQVVNGLNGIVNNYICKYKGQYLIKVSKGSEYSLDIEEINLQVCETGIAILTFKLSNSEYRNKQDILKINDFGRRIYPAFLSANDDGVCIPFNQHPEWLELKLSEEQRFKEDFSYFNNENIDNGIYRKLSNTILSILGAGVFIDNSKDISKNNILIEPIIDDRMYVMCWYGNSLLAEEICEKKNDIYQYTLNDDWYKFIYVDGGYISCTSTIMKNRLIYDNTYDRWIEYNTLYGCSKYSFVTITSGYKDLDSNGALYLLDHFNGLYYKMVRLILLQRASVLRFSDEVAKIAMNIDNYNSGIMNQIDQLNTLYIKFINNVYFREFTAQDQGIELHKIITNNLNLDKDVKNLESEIQGLHNLLSIKQEKKSSDSLQILSWLGALIALPSFLVSYFGYFGNEKLMDMMRFGFDKNGFTKKEFILNLYMIIIAPIMIIVAGKLLRNMPKNKMFKNLRNIIIYLFVLCILLIFKLYN